MSTCVERVTREALELERRIEEDGGRMGVEGMRAYYIEMEESPGE